MKKYAEREEIQKEVSENLKAYPELFRKLLVARGLDTREKAEEFLNPNFETGVHDPFLLKDMDKAVARILRAMADGERILIYSDYDADGIPAAVVMHDFFKLVDYDNFEIYIPHRHTEGYGLHLEAIETFVEKKIKLLITLDCGIVDHAEVARAKELGIDVIITDHHTPSEKLPDAFAVINPKRADCDYPYKMLCGAGVGFKLVQALLRSLDGKRSCEGVARIERSETECKSLAKTAPKPGQEKWLLDMVGLATLSDMVPLDGENRVFAHYGLKVLRKSRRPGFTKLLSIMKVNKQFLTEDDVGFMITPRINAASRMGVPTDAFHLLSTAEESRAEELASHLDLINKERKVLVGVTVKEIKKILSEREDHFLGKQVIVLGNPLWRPAILGLAANTIAEEHGKPVFLWGREDGKDIKGSCRAGGAVHVVRLMEKARGHFKEFGGHAFSGGFAVLPELVHTLEEALNDAFAALGHETETPEPEIFDAVLALDEVNFNLYNQIEKLAPFGTGNPKPLFMFQNVKPKEVKMFGKAKEHLELAFQVGASSPKKLRAIGFFMKPEDFAVQPKTGLPINLLATLEKSYFGRYPELRLRIVDII